MRKKKGMEQGNWEERTVNPAFSQVGSILLGLGVIQNWKPPRPFLYGFLFLFFLCFSSNGIFLLVTSMVFLV